ncbi:MAG: serine hydrolase domain-containing protein [Dongiaceae bacterium]
MDKEPIDLNKTFSAALSAGRLPNLHAVLALRGGDVIYERYLAGPDQAWGRPIGHVDFGPNTLHDMRSVTKSIVGLLYGIALERGQAPAPDQPLLAHFPKLGDLAADPARAALTIEHALTMTLGTEWNEDLPYTDPANSEIAMERATDRYRFVLDRPVVAAPGARWIYNGGATALLGRLIADGTGLPLPEFAQHALFEPLGIIRFEWAVGEDGEPSAASGLRLRPRDLARIGQCMLAGGLWDGRPVIPSSWLAAALRPRIAIEPDTRYGYHWYIGDHAVRAPAGTRQAHWVGAFGNGGQRLFLFPDLDLIVAIAAGNYNAPDQSKTPMVLLRDILLPAQV